jgi:hypothetical protein
MKKILLLFIAVIVVALVYIYAFIPTIITVAGYKNVNIPTGSIERLFENKNTFKKWWPGEIINDSVFVFQKTNYTILKTNALGVSIQTSISDHKITGEMTATLLKKDTSAVQLVYESFNAGINPFSRLNQYFKAIALKKQLNTFLEAYAKYAEDKKNIYGIDIIQTKVKDSSLVSTKKLFSQYPSNEDVASLINILKKHIAENGGEQKDFPMLNIRLTEENKYEAMVAIPLLKDIPVKGDIVIKKMVLGNILEAKVIGGPTSINTAETSLKNYVIDYNKTSPATPFQSLATDRAAEKDSTKWVTILKYPVF